MLEGQTTQKGGDALDKNKVVVRVVPKDSLLRKNTYYYRIDLINGKTPELPITKEIAAIYRKILYNENE